MQTARPIGGQFWWNFRPPSSEWPWTGAQSEFTPAETPAPNLNVRLAGLTDLEHRGPAKAALAAGGRSAIFHCDLLSLLNLTRLAALHAVSSHSATS